MELVLPSFRSLKCASKRILFPRSADASNLNSQAKNVQEILRRWTSTDYRPSVFSFYAPDKGVAANPNVEIISIPPNRLWRARLFAAYMGGFDAVFCPGMHHLADWLALRTRAALRRPLPVVTTIEGLIGIENDNAPDQAYSEVAGHAVYSQRIGKAHWRRITDIYRMSLHIIAISPFLAKQANARYGKKVSILPFGVNTGLFKRADWVKPSRPRVICAANVRSHKRPHVFLALARKFPQAEFVWFGDGELRLPLVEQATREGIANLSFAGALPPAALARELTASDILVLPSQSEGVPKVTQEAAAAGLAQVIFGFYKAPTVVDGVNGFVVWNDSEMAERLALLLDDRSLIERMGRAGADLAQAWSWDTIAPQWEEKIVSVLNG